MPYPLAHLCRRLAATAAWGFATVAGATYLMIQASLSASILLGSPGANAVRSAREAAIVCSLTLALALALLVGAAALSKNLRPACSRICLLYAALYLTGMPAAMAMLTLTLATGQDMRGLASPLGLIAFVIWLRTLSVALQATLMLMRPVRNEVSGVASESDPVT